MPTQDPKEPPPLPPGAAKGFLRDNLEVVCFAVLLIMFFKTFVAQQFTIPSASMRNTLQIGDHVLVNKFLFAPAQWPWEARLFPMRASGPGRHRHLPLPRPALPDLDALAAYRDDSPVAGRAVWQQSDGAGPGNEYNRESRVFGSRLTYD
jgi:hypothetical protein